MLSPETLQRKIIPTTCINGFIPLVSVHSLVQGGNIDWSPSSFFAVGICQSALGRVSKGMLVRTNQKTYTQVNVAPPRDSPGSGHLVARS